jgi:hypothetical protein
MTSSSVTSCKKVILVFKEDFVQIPTQKKSEPVFPSGWLNKASGCSLVSNIRSDDRAIPSGLPSVSRSFEQFKVASIRMSRQCVRTLITVRQEIRFPYRKTAASVRATGQYRLDAILDKARCGEEFQPSGRQGNTVRTQSLFWFLRAVEVQLSGH